MVYKIILCLRKVLLIALVITACVTRSAFGDSIDLVEMQHEIFPVFGSGSETKVAIGLTAGVYSGGSTLEDARVKVADLAEEKRMQTPEYVLMKMLDFIADDNLEGIVSLYTTDAEKERARKGDWNLDLPKYTKDEIARYELKAKVYFGPYVYIKYKPIRKEGFSVSASVVLKQTDKGYLFSKDLESDNVFIVSASAFPYWEEVKVRNNFGDLKNMQKSTFALQGSKIVLVEGSDMPETGIEFYSKIEPFSKAISSAEKDAIHIKLNSILNGYKENNTEEILKAWDPSLHSTVLSPNLNESGRKKSVSYFKTIEKIEPKYCIQSGDVLYVYASLADISGAETIKVFRFLKNQSEFFLSNKNDLANPMAYIVLQGSAFQQIVEK